MSSKGVENLIDNRTVTKVGRGTVRLTLITYIYCCMSFLIAYNEIIRPSVSDLKGWFYNPLE